MGITTESIWVPSFFVGAQDYWLKTLSVNTIFLASTDVFKTFTCEDGLTFSDEF
jgi:hypothetical protein